MQSSTRVATATAAAALLAVAVAAPSAGAAPAAPAPVTISAGPNFLHLPSPLSPSQCQAEFGVHCYSPAQLDAAYDLNPLYRKGIDGRGETIVVPVPFGSPTIEHDLHVFSQRFGLPDTTVDEVRFGAIPPYDPTSGTRVDWAAGTTLEVEWAHAIAPRARIVVAETPVSETIGVTGFPELLRAEQALVDRGVGDVVAQIEATPEQTFPSPADLLALRGAYRDAARHHVTVLGAPGDSGVINTDADGNPFPFPTVDWPSSDPLVTSVGAVRFSLDDAGRPLSTPTTWNDGFGGAGGGGTSSVFARPAYQSGVTNVAGARRGAPDIAMSGSVDGGIWVYTSFAGTGGTGWNIFDGTDESMSEFAGVVALADQYAGHRLGLLNPALYELGARAARGDRSTGLVDVTQGDNSLSGTPGFAARQGYDLVTGWGTIDAAKFVPALAKLG